MQLKHEQCGRSVLRPREHFTAAPDVWHIRVQEPRPDWPQSVDVLQRRGRQVLVVVQCEQHCEEQRAVVETVGAMGGGGRPRFGEAREMHPQCVEAPRPRRLVWPEHDASAPAPLHGGVLHCTDERHPHLLYPFSGFATLKGRKKLRNLHVCHHGLQRPVETYAPGTTCMLIEDPCFSFNKCFPRKLI